MRSKNSRAFTAAESAHIARVKMAGCVVCGASAPNDAHHIVQGLHFLTVAVCHDCHQGSHNGWHGRKAMWRIHHMDELGALNETLKRVGEMA